MTDGQLSFGVGRMAVNHADGAMFASVLFYPIAAAKGVATAGAAWLTVVLIPVGLAVGLAVTFVGREFLYAVMDFLLKRFGTCQGWVGTAVGALMLLFYILFPYAIIGAGFYATWFGSMWIVGRIL